jgi:hypothetical protein
LLSTYIYWQSCIIYKGQKVLLIFKVLCFYPICLTNAYWSSDKWLMSLYLLIIFIAHSYYSISRVAAVIALHGPYKVGQWNVWLVVTSSCGSSLKKLW